MCNGAGCQVDGDMASSVCSSRVNGSAAIVGALRYALHLRFLCPHRKCSIYEKNKLDNDQLERKFFLCSDLKVVFPQRHSDDDEGKVCMFILSVWFSLLIGCKSRSNVDLLDVVNDS